MIGRSFVFALLMLGSSIVAAAPPPVPSCVWGQDGSRFGRQRYESGWAAIGACKNPTTGKWDVTPVACRHGICRPQDWFDAWLDIDVDPDPAVKRARFVTWWAKIVTTDCDPPAAADAAICAIAKDWAARADASLNPPASPPPPPPTTYQVVKAAANANPPGTLPVYKWDGVKLGASAIARVAQGAPCNCSTKAPGTTLYCLVLERVDAMARCEAVKTP